MLSAGKVERIDDGKLRREGAEQVVNRVADKFFARAETAHLEDARVSGFSCLLGKFEFMLPRAAGPANGGEFINPAECRLVIGGHELSPDAPKRNGSALPLEALNDMLIEIIAAQNRSFVKTRLIEQLASLYAQEGQVARVQPYAGEVVTLLA